MPSISLLSYNFLSSPPFRYGVNYKERYNPQHHVSEVPHVYAVSQRAAKNLRMLDRNQVCIISGESGSGKTETAKLFMHHLLAYSGGSDGQHVTALEQQILESQPLLEAFGNAKTGLNNNSSRFGKYIEVLYEGMDKVLGARVRKYLLEKSRVVGQVEGERNFHVFYYLCDGAPAALRAKLNLKSSDHYRYESGIDDSFPPFLFFTSRGHSWDYEGQHTPRVDSKLPQATPGYLKLPPATPCMLTCSCPFR